jgi:hypothetical protein
MRTFFDKPIREDTTALFYPEKITASQFGEILDAKDAFLKNMESLTVPKEQYAEEWMETFCAWSEIEQE